MVTGARAHSSGRSVERRRNRGGRWHSSEGGHSWRSVVAGDGFYGMVGGSWGEALVTLEQKGKRAVLTEEWWTVVPLASFGDVWHCPAMCADKKQPTRVREVLG
jgi:hypothetical protein